MLIICKFYQVIRLLHLESLKIPLFTRKNTECKYSVLYFVFTRNQRYSVNAFSLKKNIFITGDNESNTVSRAAVTITKVIDRAVEKRSTSTIPEITQRNIETILEHRIQTNWQFMVILTCVLIALALAYIWQCVHRHWKSRSHQVSNTNTAVQNTSIHESHQIEFFYEEMQNTEYEDPEHYRTVECDDNSGNSDINTSQEKMDSVSIIPTSTSLSTGENVMYENQPEIDKRDINALYLTPTM